MTTYDAIVVGLGAMGSASLRALSLRGCTVLGFDAFKPPHAQGSSHGLARIIREAYFEHPAYVPLVQRAFGLWEDLERETGRALMRRTGGLMVGPPEGLLVQGTLRSVHEHGLAHEQWNAEEIRRRVPAFHPSADMIGVWEPRAGVLSPEDSIAAMLASAARHGATIRNDEPVLAWNVTGDSVEVVTSVDRYRGGQIVLAAGPWIGRLAPHLAPLLTVERVAQFWFEPRPEAAADFDPSRCPISIWQYERDGFFYAFPSLGPGVKAALHHQGKKTDPDKVSRVVGEGEEKAIRSVLERYMPGAAGRLAQSSVCMYTNTPDEHFIIDRDPEHPQVLLVSACSGHGFKFSPAIGEVAAELLMDGGTRHDLSMFALERRKAR